MNVTFYRYMKRENSTKRPASGGTSYDCILKEPSSVLDLVISLQWSGTGSPVSFNYAYIASFSRYYWVRNWTYQDRQWRAELQVDVLASWKTNIGSSYKYVLRAADTSQRNAYLMDGKYPADLDQVIDSTTANNPFRVSLPYGHYVFGIQGANSANAIGGVTFYELTPTNAKLLFNSIYNHYTGLFDPSDPDFLDVGKAVVASFQNFVRSLTNPMQYIVSVLWLPVPPVVGAAETITFADMSTGISGYPITQPAVDVTGLSISIPRSLTYDGIWQLVEPYVNYTLEFEPFGLIPLAAQDLLAYNALDLKITVDAVTGLAILRICPAGTDHCIATRTAQVGVNLSVNGSLANNTGALQSALAAGAAVASDNYVGAASGILSAAKDLAPQSRSSGSTGGFAGLWTQSSISLIRRSCGWASLDNDEKGTPVCKHLMLSTLGADEYSSGYILCEDGDISAPATIQELQAINSFLTGGFFYE